MKTVRVVRCFEIAILFYEVDISKGLHLCTERMRGFWKDIGYTYFIFSLTFDIL